MGYKQLKFFLKTTISINTIMLVRLAGGLYYKISSNRIVSLLAAVYCLAASFFITGVLIKNNLGMSTTQIIKVACSLTTYCSCALVSLFTDSEHLQVYLSDMEAIDISLGVTPDMDVPVSRFLFLADIIVQLGVAIPQFLSLLDDADRFIIVAFFIFLCGITNFTRIIMFELLWHRFRMYRRYLENTLSRVSRLQDTEDARNSIRQCMMIYKKILDTLNKSNKPVKTMIIVTVFAATPKVIALVYELISDPNELIRPMRSHELSMEVILPCVPGLLAALSRGEVARIKLVISRQILTCEDDRVREVLDDCLSFLEHRPFRYSVCRLFSVDVDMVIRLLNLYITYSLAVIQFGHIYN